MPCGKLCWRQSVPKGRTSTPSANGPPLPDDGRAGGYHHQCGDKATVHHGGPLRRAWTESRLQRRGDRGGHASGEGISASHVETELNPYIVIAMRGPQRTPGGDAWPRSAVGPARACRRGDRIARRLLRRGSPLLAQSGQVEPSPVCPLSGVKRTRPSRFHSRSKGKIGDKDVAFW